MRIAIAGAGGIGGVVGGMLSKSGYDITLVDQWHEHLEKIKKDGLIVKTRDGEYLSKPKVIHISELQNQEIAFDMIFIAVKSYDTEWVSMMMKNYIEKNEGFFVNFQNGVNDERMANIVGAKRSLGCIITIGAAAYEPGIAIRTDNNSPAFKIAEQDGSTTIRVKKLVEIMNFVGKTELSNDLWGERWSKLITNCMANALAGLSGYGTAEVRTELYPRKIGIQLGSEVAKVAKALGHNIYSVGGVSPEALIDAADGKNVEELENSLAESGKRAGSLGYPSFAQDVKKGRRNEIEFLNGYVSKMGKKVGIQTPFNDKIVEIIKGLGINFSSDKKHLEPLIKMLNI